MVKRKLTVGGLIGNLASVTHYHWYKRPKKKLFDGFFFGGFCMFFPTCNFFLEYDPRFSVAPFQMKPDWNESNQATFTFLT
jgi:hypothetical protein